MKKAILVDLHKTLLNKDGSINKTLVDFINYSSDDCKILVFTAASMAIRDVEADARRAKIKFDVCFSLDSATKDDDIDRKLFIYENQIKPEYDIELLIDNNKKCCKAFNKIGIDSLQYRESN